MSFVMQRSRSGGSANQKFDGEHKGFQPEFHQTPSKQQTNNKQITNKKHRSSNK